MTTPDLRTTTLKNLVERLRNNEPLLVEAADVIEALMPQFRDPVDLDHGESAYIEHLSDRSHAMSIWKINGTWFYRTNDGMMELGNSKVSVCQRPVRW